MKASVLTKYRSPKFFEFKEIEKPVPEDKEVLVKVHAVSINSWDWEILMGKPFVNRLMAGLLKPGKIKILGCDIAGRIETTGRHVKKFQRGDEVFGDISGGGWGGFAEYVCAYENALVSKPASMTFEQAAAIPQAAVLALQGLRKGRIQQEHNIRVQKILINGAGGGVGSFAVPMAKLFGAEVTGVDSTEKLDMMRLLGADHVIDYRQEDFTKNGQSYDLVLDVMGTHSIFDYKRALSHNGAYVMVGGATSLVNQVLFIGPWISMTSGKKMGLLFHKPNTDDLNFIKTLFESDKVKPVIDKCYPLSETAEAMRYYGSGHVKGKVVITLDEY